MNLSMSVANHLNVLGKGDPPAVEDNEMLEQGDDPTSN